MKHRVCVAVIISAVMTLGVGCDRSNSDRKHAKVMLERETTVAGPVDASLSRWQRPDGLSPHLAQTLAEQEAKWRELPDLLRRAEQGDMEAAAKLGHYLLTCVGRRDAEAIKRRFDQQLAEAKEQAQMDSRREDIAISNAKFRYANGMIQHEACSKLGEAQIANYHVWLEKAGRAGVASAKLAYMSSALKQFEGKSALVANIEEAARRRGIARAWMEEILQEKGHPDREAALRKYVAELNGEGNGLFAPDQQRAIVYQYVLEMVVASRVDADPRMRELMQSIAQRRGKAAPSSRLAQLWQNGPDRHGGLSDQQWQQIADEGRDIFSRDFGPVP